MYKFLFTLFLAFFLISCSSGEKERNTNTQNSNIVDVSKCEKNDLGYYGDCVIFNNLAMIGSWNITHPTETNISSHYENYTFYSSGLVRYTYCSELTSGCNGVYSYTWGYDDNNLTIQKDLNKKDIYQYLEANLTTKKIFFLVDTKIVEFNQNEE